MTLQKFFTILCFYFLTGCKTSQSTLSPTLAGEYTSLDNKFEKWSILTLNSNSTFIYSYLLGGCQDKIKGKWTTKAEHISLYTDINKDTVAHHIPDLNNISWTITKKVLKPNSVIDNGCFKEQALHLKVKEH